MSHRETFPSRADDYGYTIRPKLERAQDVKPEDVEAAYAAVHAWRRYEPPVDLYVAPCVTGELPPEDVGRARRALPPVCLRALGQSPRLGGARDRQPPADRAARRDACSPPASPGSRPDADRLRRQCGCSGDPDRRERVRVIEDLERVVRPRLELEALVQLRVFDHDRQAIIRRAPEERDLDAVVGPSVRALLSSSSSSFSRRRIRRRTAGGSSSVARRKIRS